MRIESVPDSRDGSLIASSRQRGTTIRKTQFITREDEYLGNL